MKKLDKKSIVYKTIKRIIIITIVILCIFLISKAGQKNVKQQYLNSINYDIILLENGDMKITETWDVYIGYTNTLFKNFTMSSKFGDIINVKVKDLDSKKDLNRINEEMYHVTKDCYYALPVSTYKYEIAWGTGMEKKTGYKKYQVTYTITDVVIDYKDCQELYWQLFSDSNSIPAKKITGKITLPNKVQNIDNLRVWGHGPLNGEIRKLSDQEVEFKVDGLNSGRMLEIRLVTQEKIFENLKKVRDYSYLKTVLYEEEKWATKTNEGADIFNYIWIIVIIIYIVIVIKYILKLVKYQKIAKQRDDGLVRNRLKYYRDIPREQTATPAEANYLYMFTKDLNKDTKYQSDIIAATILDLCLKKCIKIRTEKDEVYIKIINSDIKLQDDEKAVLDLLIAVSNKQEEFNIEELKKYAKKYYTNYSQYINKVINSARNSLYENKLVDKANQQEYIKSSNAGSKYSVILWITITAVIGILLGSIRFFEPLFIVNLGINAISTITKLMIGVLPLIILKLANLKMLSNIQKKIAILTQEGQDERVKWKALANYMKDFSLLDEKDVPSLEIWEKYLVYATAFGIANEVIEQMKAKYPEVFVEEYWEENEKDSELYNVLRIATITYHNPSNNVVNNLKSNANSAYDISLREISLHSSSSGSGGGGGFSGGGRGRWWWRPEWAEDKNYHKN